MTLLPRSFFSLLAAAFVFAGMGAIGTLHAADAICVGVQVEIDQTLTLERQAFDAKMTVKNGLPDQALQDVSVTLNFLNADQSPATATTSPEAEWPCSL